ncbi:AI-2E family transporter [Geotalea sp. SG265]|uniref:AI-2E family transporter n=1 Tax=Geotalea sp. SG265 TaxID=2922867 RepID=UPI001FAFC533|nr:AI-2E family transporter [Geotalea sp. SG265]
MISDKKLLIAFVLSVSAALAVVFLSGTVFLPVFIALILTYILNPLVALLTGRGVNRTLAIIIVFFALVLLATLATVFFVVSIKGELGSIELNLPEYANRLYDYIPAGVKAYLDIETPEKAYRHLTEALDRLRSISFSLFKESFAVVTRAFSSTLAFVLSILGYCITPVYLFYFLQDMPELKAATLNLVPERHRPGVCRRAAELNEVLSAFVRGQLLLCAILAVLYSIGLYVIGIDLAILIGTMAGVLFIVPYLGTLFGIVFSMLMAFLKFHDFLHPLLCLGWFILVQAAEGTIITPKIVGDKVGLHPVVTIIALLLGGQWFGIFGMLLAVPVTAVLNVFFRSLLDYYRSTAYYTGA